VIDPQILAVVLKLGRAQEHLETLRERAEGFFEEDTNGLYRLRGELNSQGTKLLFKVVMLRELPVVEWGVIAGDAIHCMRSALDQLVYQYSAFPDENTAFPIFRTKKGWYTRAPAMLYGVPETVIAVLHGAQPYHRGDAANSHPLAILSSLSNADKHKAIPVMAVAPRAAETKVTSTQGIASHGAFNLKTGRPLKEGAVIADMSIKPDKSGLSPEVQMDGEISFDIAFDEGSFVPSSIVGRPFPIVHNEIAGYVAKLLVEFHEAVAEYLRAVGIDPDAA
jgi:hypothetical protein